MERETTFNQSTEEQIPLHNQNTSHLKTEVWLQDPHNQDLWHGANGVIVNSEALEYREEFFEIKRKYH
ncbi:MAG TPA: hypothetical protein ENJ44_06400 [Oceanospirillales bacterium]|nr:hypothetical protein [Oceanospirillales bacterium]